MATLAADNTRVDKAAAAAPISAHPAFPAIVALWFAALLGLGSLILPTVLLERLATVTGIASLVPSAAPPLGFTARATIAVAAACAGAVLGLVLARQVAKGREPRPRARFGSDDLPRCRPISAHDELGEEGLGAPAPRAGGVKRRSLAIAEDSGPSPYLQAAPLPGHETAAAETAEDDADDTLELGAFAEQGGAEAAKDDQDFSMTDETESDLPSETIAPTGRRQEFGTRSEAGATLPRAFDPLPQPEAEADDEAPSLEPFPFSAPSLRRMAPATGADGEQDNDEAFPAGPGEASAPIPQAFEPPAEHAPRLTVVESASEEDCAAADLSDERRPLDELGLVQLATRLGAVIERRRAQRAAQPGASRVGRSAFTAEEDFDAAQAEEAARARADFFGGSQPADAFERTPARPAGRPSPLGELEFDEEDDFEALSDSFSLPLRTRSEAVEAERTGAALAADASEEESDDPTAEHEYTSLLAMKNPFRKEDEFVRVEEPEPEEDDIEATVTFPERKTEQAAASSSPARPFDPPGNGAGKTPADRPRTDGDAERELRAALETLQRMSGTA